MPRLVIVDRQDLVRVGLKATLSDEQGLEIVGEAVDSREALELCRHARPDLVLMEVRMPEMDGLAATREIKQHFPNVGVLILTVHENLDYMWEAIKAGAAGYMLKDVPRHQLAMAIRKVLDGEIALTRDLATQLLRRLADGARRESATALHPKGKRAVLIRPLTSRELEVLRLVALGQTNQQIGRNLTLSTGTIKNYLHRAKIKLDASDRTQAVVRAFELGILSLPEP